MVNSPPDLLVVGSGVAGAMVALTAIQRGQTVLCLLYTSDAADDTSEV